MQIAERWWRPGPLKPTVTDASLTVRPMTMADAESVTWLARRAYTATSSTGSEPQLAPWAENPDLNGPAAKVRPVQLVRHIIGTDPNGCFVLIDQGNLKGAVMTASREGLLALAMLAVAPQSRSQGVGTSLIEPVSSLIDGSPRSMAVVSGVPESIGFLFRLGFDVHPALRAEGVVDRSQLPELSNIREGTAADRSLCEAIDRRMRGASRGPDHELFESAGRLFVAESGRGQGYAYARDNGSPMTVAATQTNLARALLFACLASGSPGTPARVSNLTGEQRWAYDVVRSVGLELYVAGPVMVRGMGLPAPYLPHDVLG